MFYLFQSLKYVQFHFVCVCLIEPYTDTLAFLKFCILQTILFPVTQIIIILDGVTSTARSYLHTEMLELAKQAENEIINTPKYKNQKSIKYEWVSFKKYPDYIFPVSLLFPMTILIGYPKQTKTTN